MLWLIASAVAVAAAGYVYLIRERLGVEGAGLTLLRAVAFLALFALLANVAVRRADHATPVTVAVDASLSMDDAGTDWRAVMDTARVLAGRNGVALRFGSAVVPLDSASPTDGRSQVGDVLRVAVARGGAVFVVTDGELDDFAGLPRELRERARLVLIPRAAGAGLAVTEATVPERVLVGDSVPVALEVATWGSLTDSIGDLTVRAGGRVLLRRALTLPPAPGRGRRTVMLPPGVLGSGTHVLEIAVRAPGDTVTRDDTRLRLVEVTQLPAAVLVAQRLDWEARFLARELADVVPGGVQTFGDLGDGRWVDMRTQRRVSAGRVDAAVRGASVVLIRGDVPAAAGARRVWRWPAGTGGLEGDWYVASDLPASALVPRLGGLVWDSLAPLAGVLPVEMAGWRAVLTARLGRRGAQRVVLAARDTAGRRELLSAAGGFWRWAFRGAGDREVYRAMLAAGVEWLLEGSRQGAVAAVQAEPVVPRGIPVTFRWMSGEAPGDSIAIDLAGPDSTLKRWVTFGPDGTAAVRMVPGVYRWRVRDPVRAEGTVAVEAYSPEFVPRTAVVPEERVAMVQSARVGLRELWWGFAIAMLALLIEWAWRLRRGLP